MCSHDFIVKWIRNMCVRSLIVFQMAYWTHHYSIMLHNLKVTVWHIQPNHWEFVWMWLSIHQRMKIRSWILDHQWHVNDSSHSLALKSKSAKRKPLLSTRMNISRKGSIMNCFAFDYSRQSRIAKASLWLATHLKIGCGQKELQLIKV